jgi:ATP-binding cassette, subfamily F, member 3
MIIASCNGISLSFGTNRILENISFHINESDKAGIVGVNGAGKSTLFRILSGLLQSDTGDIFIAKGCKIGYLEQNTGLDSSRTLWDELMTVYAPLIEMEHRIKRLEEGISKEKDAERLAPLMKEYATLSDKYANSGGYEYTSRVRGVLRGLGFSEHQFHSPVRILSGGQKTRLALAKILLEEPDLLLMDEPTNHLDIHALEWLEDFLKNYRKSVMIISHDRYFLDAVCNKTMELENCECRVYNTNYSGYMKQKAIDREVQQKHFDLQQKEIARQEAFIEQQRRWNREKNIVAAESRQKAIDRMEKVDKPKNLPNKIRIQFRSGIVSGNDVLFVEDLTKEYPGKPLFRKISFKLHKSERVFLLGPNGCGKSTLLKILTGRMDKAAGNFEYGHKVNIGYYDQEQEDLDESRTVLEEVWNYNEKITQTELRTALASFLFEGEDVFKPVSILSGGEKSRVALAKLMLSGSNLLFLDEPTNHLDINSREVLERALQDYDGTILAVSHDRYFINKLATRVLEMDGSSLIDCPGNYSFYQDYRSKQKKTSSSDTAETKVSASKLERQADKEEKTRQRRLERQLAETEQEISRLEERLAAIDKEMETAASDHVRLQALHDEQTACNARLEELYVLWEELANQG